jgi:hypothetical protein
MASSRFAARTANGGWQVVTAAAVRSGNGVGSSAGSGLASAARRESGSPRQVGDGVWVVSCRQLHVGHVMPAVSRRPCHNGSGRTVVAGLWWWDCGGGAVPLGRSRGAVLPGRSRMGSRRRPPPAGARGGRPRPQMYWPPGDCTSPSQTGAFLGARNASRLQSGARLPRNCDELVLMHRDRLLMHPDKPFMLRPNLFGAPRVLM